MTPKWPILTPFWAISGHPGFNGFAQKCCGRTVLLESGPQKPLKTGSKGAQKEGQNDHFLTGFGQFLTHFDTTFDQKPAEKFSFR